MRLIDADALCKLARNHVDGTVDCNDIMRFPTIDAVPIVHGYNLLEDTPSLFECSVCGWGCHDTYYGDTDTYNYCPNCGAKMDGKENADADS